MAKPNYRQAKRQKELARKVRQEHKLQRRSARMLVAPEDEKQDVSAVSDESPPTSSTHDT